MSLLVEIQNESFTSDAHEHDFALYSNHLTKPIVTITSEEDDTGIDVNFFINSVLPAYSVPSAPAGSSWIVSVGASGNTGASNIKILLHAMSNA